MKVLIAVEDDKLFPSTIDTLCRSHKDLDSVQIFIISVVEPVLVGHYTSILPSAMLSEITRNAFERACDLTRRLSALLANHQCTGNITEIVADGFADAEILRAAAEMEIDLIILGLHRRREGIAGWMDSSASRGVIHKANCPVLIIQPPDQCITKSTSDLSNLQNIS